MSAEASESKANTKREDPSDLSEDKDVPQKRGRSPAEGSVSPRSRQSSRSSKSPLGRDGSPAERSGSESEEDHHPRNPDCCVVVVGLTPNVTKEHLNEIVGVYSQVVNAHIVKVGLEVALHEKRLQPDQHHQHSQQQQSHRGQRHAVVEVESPEAAEEVAEALHTAQVDGQTISVVVYADAAKRNAFITGGLSAPLQASPRRSLQQALPFSQGRFFNSAARRGHLTGRVRSRSPGRGPGSGYRPSLRPRDLAPRSPRMGRMPSPRRRPDLNRLRSLSPRRGGGGIAPSKLIPQRLPPPRASLSPAPRACINPPLQAVVDSRDPSPGDRRLRRRRLSDSSVDSRDYARKPSGPLPGTRRPAPSKRCKHGSISSDASEEESPRHVRSIRGIRVPDPRPPRRTCAFKKDTRHSLSSSSSRDSLSPRYRPPSSPANHRQRASPSTSSSPQHHRTSRRPITMSRSVSPFEKRRRLWT